MPPIHIHDSIVRSFIRYIRHDHVAPSPLGACICRSQMSGNPWPAAVTTSFFGVSQAFLVRRSRAAGNGYVASRFEEKHGPSEIRHGRPGEKNANSGTHTHREREREKFEPASPPASTQRHREMSRLSRSPAAANLEVKLSTTGRGLVGSSSDLGLIC